MKHSDSGERGQVGLCGAGLPLTFNLSQKNSSKIESIERETKLKTWRSGRQIKHGRSNRGKKLNLKHVYAALISGNWNNFQNQEHKRNNQNIKSYNDPKEA